MSSLQLASFFPHFPLKMSGNAIIAGKRRREVAWEGGRERERENGEASTWLK